MSADIPRKERSDIVAHCSVCGRGKTTDDGEPCRGCLVGTTWTTGDELAFVRGRSDKGRDVPGAGYLTAREFLTGYLKGARLRTDWYGLDREVILRTAEALLAAKERP